MTAARETDLADLVALGLTQYEAKGYLGLLGREQATPTEVARVTGLPRQRTYDVLATLAERGLVAPVPGKAVAYRAMPPEQVLDRLVSLRRAALARQQELAADLTSRLGALYAHGRLQDDPLDYVEVLHDAEHAAHRIGQLVAEATSEVVGMVRPPYAAPPAVAEAQVSAVRQRVLYERSVLDNPALRDLVGAYASLGEEVRIAAELPLKVAVIDGATVAFSLPDPVGGRDRETTLIVHHRMLAATMLLAFESVWSQATALPEAIAEKSSG
ncbi:TrmB family transcriptional regulator [Ornithinicoccus hortensis]|uniref:Sugar-specific transcriptional regulator TrmB n=1 Tax=Ornithinicoccus hortensis TaxID=82346 RepID=A0A542YN04_9MICO|nr:helix-turn-helix domain-containing protein [Ornithinicoccus hortensis]TQL49485.1 sugar-specific transcriptional regulator TrmB [Ornithinicoccus hortensis]